MTMTRLLVLACSAAFLTDAHAEIQTFRVGDDAHPWTLRPVTGRLDLGRSWVVELIADDDGDGLIDEDPVELIDNDDDGAINEDPLDGKDNDIDGLIDEDGPDEQIDNDGDGQLNEDGRFSQYDDDWDGLLNEDPINGVDDDGDGLIDEDPPKPEHGGGVTTWIRPILLDDQHNLAYMLNQRFKAGEFGGLVPGGGQVLDPFMVVPSEYGFRREEADPISGHYWAAAGTIPRVDSEKGVDGNLTTAFTATKYSRGGLGVNLKGFFYINRIVFRPRPTLPGGTIANYYIQYGDETSISVSRESIQAPLRLVPPTRDQLNPVIKDLRFDPPVVAGRIDLHSIDPEGKLSQTAELAYFGDGYPLDANYTSAIIDVGTPTPRIRRYEREIEQFSLSKRVEFERQFRPDVAGRVVNWGKVRWRGRRDGSDGDVRIQFRVGNSLDTQVYSRFLGPGLTDTNDENGEALDLFSWIKISEGRVPERELQYNELGADIGDDGELGWSYWSAPFQLADGNVEGLPESEWANSGVPLPLPGGTRYIQFRIFFDSEQHSAGLLDFIEFDYDSPLTSGGVLTEIFPPRVPLGEETSFNYFIRPRFDSDDRTSFNRIEIAVPSTATRIDTLRVDGQDWMEVAGTDDAVDPLLSVTPTRLAPAAGSADSLGQFVQAVAVDPSTNSPTLMIKLPRMGTEHFRLDQNIEVVFRSTLFRGSKEFTSELWNDDVDDPSSTIPQPTDDGDATPDVATNSVLVVVDDIASIVNAPDITPNPFTPNGDGVNDVATFDFELFLLLENVDVELGIYDLSGRRVVQLQNRGSNAGRQRIDWNGRDAAGKLVPPGSYIYRLVIGSDDASSERVGTVSLAY